MRSQLSTVALVVASILPISLVQLLAAGQLTSLVGSTASINVTVASPDLVAHTFRVLRLHNNVVTALPIRFPIEGPRREWYRIDLLRTPNNNSALPAPPREIEWDSLSDYFEADSGGGEQVTIVADPGNHRAWLYDPITFALTPFAGNGLAGVPVLGGPPHLTTLDTPVAVAIHGDGVAIADCDNDVVLAVADALGKGENDRALSLIAGIGTRGFSGDGGLAPSAQLSCPSDLEFDAAGNLYILDSGNNRVRKVVNPFAPAAVITTVAGSGGNAFFCPGDIGDGGPATSACLATPAGIALSPDDTELAIADSQNHRVRAVSLTTGLISTIAGSGLPAFQGDGGPATSAALNSPSDVVYFSATELYIGDTNNARLRRVLDGVITTVAGSGQRDYNGENVPGPVARIARPRGIATDAIAVVALPDMPALIAGAATVNQHVYWAEPDNHRVRMYNPVTGLVATVAGTGVQGLTGNNGPALSARLRGPADVFVTVTEIFIVDQLNCLVRKIDRASGIISIAAGSVSATGFGQCGFAGDSGPATEARLNFPSGVWVRDGSIYIADQNNHRIRVVDPSGIMTTLAGSGRAAYSGDGGPAASAQLNFPASVTVDDAGTVYVADVFNDVVRRIATDAARTISTVAGTGTPGYSGDGGLATSAQLAFPADVAVTAGQLLIADSGNNMIRRVRLSAAPTIDRVAGTGTPGSFGNGGPSLLARLYAPVGLAVLMDGSIVISDANNRSIRLLDAGAVTPATGPPGPPGTPVVAVSGNSVTFGWTAPTTGAPPTRYTLHARAGAGGPLLLSLPVGNMTTFSASPPNGTFHVTVSAANGEGTSPESTGVTFSVPAAVAAPGAPQNLTANVSGNSVSFAWTAPTTGGTPAGYALRAALTPGGAPFAQLPLGALTGTTVPGVPVGIYYVTVVAQNAGGPSTPSNEVVVTVGASQLPGTPTLNAPQVSGTTVTLSWAAAATGGTPTGYVITAALTPGGAPVASITAGGLSITVPNVPPGTYHVRVTAVNAIGSSTQSNEVAVVVN